MTHIGDFAFSGCKLTSITIPNSVTSIGKKAFLHCSDLEDIVIPNSVAYIGESAFANCDSLISFTIPNNPQIKIEWPLFGYFDIGYGCDKLEEIIFPDNIDEDIFFATENNVFYGCNNIKSIRTHSSPYPPRWITDKMMAKYPRFEKLKKSGEKEIAKKMETLKGFVEIAFLDGKISKIPTLEEYLKSEVEREVNMWQLKGEFESSSDWKLRVNEATRNNKIEELVVKYRKEYQTLQDKQKTEYEAVRTAFYNVKDSLKRKAFKSEQLSLSVYDADNQSFMIKSGNEGFADILLPVSSADAPSFKANWEKIKLTATLNYVPNGDDVALTAVTFKDGDKTYTYDSNTKAKYAVTEIDYNFKPIELAMTEGDNINYTFNPLEEMAQRVVTTPEQDLSKRQNGVTVEQKKLSVGGLADVDTDIPSGAQAANNTFAVIIGNENYSQVSKVPYAQNDAKIFATYCQKTLGLPQKNIKTYTDATFGILLSAVDNIKKIAEAYKGNLNVIFYYAGHGLPNEDSKDAFLLPVDADGRNTAACYATNKLYEELAGLGAKSVTVFMDACFSGAQRGEGMLASARGVAIKPRDVEPKGNMVVFSAASADETAYPYTEKGHGLFTYFLLKKLQESKGNATLGELGSYIREKVSQESIVTNGKSQTPTIVSSAALGDGWKNMRLK